jgi:hypothetical protein
MKMDVRKPLGVEIAMVARNEGDARPKRSRRAIKYAASAFVGVAMVYVLASLSAAALAAIDVVFLALVGIATAVCVYAQNNTR